MAGAGLLAAGLVAVLGASANPAGAADGNLLTNAGFESGLTGWSCDDGATVSSPVHSGSAALAGTPTASDTAQCTQTVSVAPNSAYTLSGYVQGSYVYLGATGSGVNASTWTQAASGYTQLSTTFTTGASTTSVTVFVHGWYGQSAYHADDLNLTGPAGSGGGGGGGGGAPPPRRHHRRTPVASPTPST